MTFHNAGQSEPIQDWRTPPYIFNELHSEFDFGHDLFADDENALLPNYYTAQNSVFPFDRRHAKAGFGNPEYGKGFIGRVIPWAINAVRVERRWPKLVLLVPLTIPKQWGTLAFRECEIQLYAGRIGFVRPGPKKAKTGNNAGSMLVIVNNAEDPFRGVSAIRDAKTGKIIIDYREGT